MECNIFVNRWNWKSIPSIPSIPPQRVESGIAGRPGIAAISGHRLV